MKSITLYLKRNLYFIISLLTVFLTVVFAIVLLFVLDLGKSVAQTSVGFVYLGSYEPTEYEEVLTPRILQWQDTADYELSYQEYSWEIDLNYFVFEAEETADQVRSDVNNPAIFSLSEANETLLYQDLSADLPDQIVDFFDFDALLDDIAQDMKLLKNRKLYELKYYLDETLYETVIDTVTIDQIDPQMVDDIIASFVSPLIIHSNERFHVIEAFQDTTLSNEALSIIASALQYVTVKTPVEGYMFDTYKDLPLWADSGMNVRVLKLNNYDFSFYNPLNEEMQLTIEKTANDTLVFTLQGLPFLTTYERIVALGPTIYYQTTILDNTLLDSLTPGVVITETVDETIYELTITSGVNGYVTYYKRVSKPLNGAQTEDILYSEQVLPIQEVIEQHIVPKE